MKDYADWAARHPKAARDLQVLLGAAPWPRPDDSGAKGEAGAQQQVRFKVARAGAKAWRNNVGATPSRCPDCGVSRRPVRYGLANDSAELNAVIKSHDLILAIPRLITSDMVGTTIAPFGRIETQAPGWVFTGKGREAGQLAWAALIASVGGYASFSTGEVHL